MGRSSTGRGETTTVAAFWLEQAVRLKETAELSWEAERKVMQQARLLYSPHPDRRERHANEELGIELNLLYRYLLSMAIQYLAIGILLTSNPDFFVTQRPGHHVVALLQACGISLSRQQERLLRESESAYEWAERYPAGGDLVMQRMAHRLSREGCISREQKEELEALYEQLRQRAEG